MPTLHRTITTTLLSLAAATFVGCGEKIASQHGDDSIQHALGAVGNSAASRLTNTDNGLHMRSWIIDDRAPVISAVLAPYAVESPLDPQTAERLRRNGMRFFRIPLEEVETVLRDLGGASMDVSSWHGQVFEWRDLVRRNIAANGQAVAIDGRVRRYEAGAFLLVFRAWTMATEDGPALHLEFGGRFEEPKTATGYRRLLGDEQRGTELLSLSAEARLERGWVYILTCEAPASTWSADPASPAAPLAPSAGPADFGAGPDAGPAAAPPRTVGEVMLRGDSGRPTRGLLVFEPRLRAAWPPPPSASSSTSPNAKAASP